MDFVRVKRVVKITIQLKFARSKFAILVDVIKDILSHVDTSDMEAVDSETLANMNIRNM